MNLKLWNLTEKKKYHTHKLKNTRIVDSYNNKNALNYKQLLPKKDDSNKKENNFSNKFLILNNISNNSLNTQKITERELNSNDKQEYLKEKNKSVVENNNLNHKNDINIKEYLYTEYDDMIFDDLINRDKRKFCEYFTEKIKTNLMIINTFVEEPFKPRPIKIILFILDIDLYLFINALFINEEFISRIFHSKKKDNFFSFISRCLDRCFYTTLVGIIFNYLIEYFFIEEKKIKGILKRNKDNLVILKYEISQVIKDILKRFRYFIIISFIITFFSFYYLSCFNNIYPYIKNEWIKSSIFIIIIMQILSIIGIFIESIFRFISFRFKSEKIYKISLFLS